MIPGLEPASVLILEGHTDSIGGISWLPDAPSDDIAIYIKGKTEEIQKRHKKLPVNWLSDTKAAEMAETAQGLFIWVKTAFGKS